MNMHTEPNMDFNIADDVNATENLTPSPWGNGHLHGIPILETKLSPEQQLYWENYNTTTYLTLDTPYKSYLNAHIGLLLIAAFVVYPFVLILNNLESAWYLPLLCIYTLLSILSCILYSIFINNVPELYPNMAYSKMVTGLAIFALLQFLFAVIFSIKRYLYNNGTTYSRIPSANSSNTNFSDNIHLTGLNIKNLNTPNTNDINLHEFASPSSTLFDEEEAHERGSDSDSFNLDEGIDNSPLYETEQEIQTQRNPVQVQSSLVSKLSSYPFLTFLASKFSTLFTILHNAASWGLFFYHCILLPTGIADLNIMGQGQRVFNLLAHFIKGEIFLLLGVLSLTRYCGCFSGVGGAWNYSFVDFSSFSTPSSKGADNHANSGINGIGSGGSNVKQSLWIRLHRMVNPNGGLICSFEFFESLLIFIYGCSNVFLEHLASTDGVWKAKDLQHVSIAFMYFGAGLCGLITEYKLSSWRRSLFEKNASAEMNKLADNGFSNKLVSPGFSPNPFPVFTIFWTGVLMSKHAQPSALSTEIHVQWGSLLTYGSFFRIITFFIMSYYPNAARDIFKPAKPLTELITSFCLICGGMVFMESTDQVIEALAYRGLTPMFTINVSVGIVSLIMAWIMTLCAVKDWLRDRM